MGWGVALLMTLWLLSTLLAVKYYVKSQTLPQAFSQKDSSHHVSNPVANQLSSTAGTQASAGGPVLLFRDLPARVQLRESSVIGIEGLQFDYRGSYLSVRFNLRYNLTDGGRQQGHFVILARGPETLMTYPDNILNLSSSQVLFSPDRGEYYSVGKFREVEATFPLTRKKATFKELQVLIFDEDDQLIRQQVLPLITSSAAVSSGQTLPRPVIQSPVDAEPAPVAPEAETPQAAPPAAAEEAKKTE